LCGEIYCGFLYRQLQFKMLHSWKNFFVLYSLESSCVRVLLFLWLVKSVRIMVGLYRNRLCVYLKDTFICQLRFPNISTFNLFSSSSTSSSALRSPFQIPLLYTIENFPCLVFPLWDSGSVTQGTGRDDICFRTSRNITRKIFLFLYKETRNRNIIKAIAISSVYLLSITSWRNGSAITYHCTNTSDYYWYFFRLWPTNRSLRVGSWINLFPYM
jgi:hypothetical protein